MDQHSGSDKLKYAHDVLGTLLEAAIRDQRLTGSAIQSMDRVSRSLAEQGRQLPGSVVAAVSRDLKPTIDAAAETLTKRVKDANVQAGEAAEAFRRATKQATFFVLVPALLITAATMALWYGVTEHAVSRLEDERASLQATVDELSSRGGRLDVRTCRLEDGTVDTCIRVGSQGYGSGYHIPVWKK
ncbi:MULTISPECIES: hypothetical protein [Paraburkholderia]|uniref:hypothetical protein n=1 Tax=Paraburkholderia TaxID=1822464 RepID=UPI0003648ED8|nr:MULTISPECIES: hypothetical protein [Paraburkholderia]MDH6148249.1 phosphoribosyl-dephospho-CoA transferase [Paraburkholderia sp. WSM4179]